ncbi:MAG: aspartate kinase, partial [Betaproteobacteria bacterium]|nr:aspartate kinase [Betaproteobacteria bacterium]
MALIVHKYGGTSMGSVERIKNVAARVAKWHRAGYNMVVVPSAMSGETNRLIGLAKEIQSQPDPRELDMLACTGEQVSVGLLAMALKAIGVDAVSYAGWQLPVRTDNAYTKARITGIDTEKVHRDLQQARVVIITGIAAALEADECLIYTDVDGVYTTDPRIVAEARRLERITFEEMLEMASLGSKVLQIRSVEFAGKYRVKTRVLSSLTPPDMDLATEAQSGTLITFEEGDAMEQAVISGIAFNRDEAKITLTRVPDRPGVAFSILGPVAEANIDVDMIIQNQSQDGSTDFSFTVHRNEYERALAVLRENVLGSIGAKDLVGDPKIAKVSVVGIGMRSHVGIASLMFKTLSAEGINIQMISTSEIKISVVIEDKYMELAVRALHKAFGLE